MKTFQQYLEARREHSLSVEPMQNGLIHVRDRQSGLMGTWYYTRQNGKIIVGKHNAGDCGRHPEFGATTADVQKAVNELK